MALVEGTDLRFAIANTAFEELLGRSDIIGKLFNEAFPELDDQGVDDILKGVDGPARRSSRTLCR